MSGRKCPRARLVSHIVHCPMRKIPCKATWGVGALGERRGVETIPVKQCVQRAVCGAAGALQGRAEQEVYSVEGE